MTAPLARWRREADALRLDLRWAAQLLRTRPAFAVAAVVPLALGIGATTTVFSVSEALLLRPLGYHHADRLVSVQSRSLLQEVPNARVSAGALAEWQDAATSFEALAGYRWTTADFSGSGPGSQMTRLRGLAVTPEFFDVFSVSVRGRTFGPEDRGARTLVLSDRVWRHLLDADERKIGGTVDLYVRNFDRVGPTRHTILGVATAPVPFPPLTGDFHLGVASVIDTIDYWEPRFVSPSGDREGRWYDVVGRLRPSVTVTEARAEMEAIVGHQSERFPETDRGWSVRVIALRDRVAGESTRGVWLLGIGTGLLLLIACANVATLLLASGAARRGEVAVRSALGAPRWRVVRQFLTEGTLIAALAGGLGIVLAWWTIVLARPWLPARLPLLQTMEVNLAVASFTVLCAGGTALVTGIVPAFRSADAVGSSRTGGEVRTLTARRGQRRLIGALITIEVALTLVLFVGTALLAGSAVRVFLVDPGFNPTRLLTMTISLPENKFTWNRNAAFASDVIDAVRSLPSVSQVAVVQGLPMGDGSFYDSGEVEGYVPPTPAEAPVWRLRVVSPDYFDVMQIPVVAGRTLESRDGRGEIGRPRVAVVSRSFAERFWPAQDPIGKHIGPRGVWRPVVGVVGDVRYSGLETDPTVDVYLPQGLFPQPAITLVARTFADPLDSVSAVRAAVHGIDTDAFVTDVRTMEQVVAESQAERRATALLVTTFGVLALVLVIAGIYSVVAQAVVQQQREMAIRAALGADARRIVTLQMRTVLQPALIGLALGAVGALGAARLLESLLFEIGSADVLAWLVAFGIVVAGCVGASYLPARQAARADLMAGLRSE